MRDEHRAGSANGLAGGEDVASAVAQLVDQLAFEHVDDMTSLAPVDGLKVVPDPAWAGFLGNRTTGRA